MDYVDSSLALPYCNLLLHRKGCPGKPFFFPYDYVTDIPGGGHRIACLHSFTSPYWADPVPIPLSPVPMPLSPVLSSSISVRYIHCIYFIHVYLRKLVDSLCTDDMYTHIM